MPKFRLLAWLLLSATLAACSGEQSEETSTQVCTTSSDCSDGETCEKGYCQADAPATGDGEADVDAEGTAQGAPGVHVTVTSSDCKGEKCTVSKGATVTFQAPDVAGFRFTGWSGDDVCKGTDPTLVLKNVGKDVKCIANYVQRVIVTGLAADGGAAPVAASKSAFAKCDGGVCEVDINATVTLTAAEHAGARFGTFNGAGCEDVTGVTSTVVAKTNVTCTATYVRNAHVTGNVVGADAQVSASSTSPGNQCIGNSCAVDLGGSVTLTVSEVDGFRFIGWSGDEGCSGTSLAITLNNVQADHTCTATYAQRFTVAGQAQGASPTPVIAASSGNDGASCANGSCTVDAKSIVVLTAPTVPGYRFTNWTGTGCDNASGAAVTIDPVTSDVTCVAHYVQGIAVTGSTVGADGSKDVVASSSTPAAMCTGTQCVVDVGGTVTLTAPSFDNFRFLGWTGDAGCTGNTLAIVISNVQSSVTCTANYVARLSVSGTANPANGGTVKATSPKQPPEANCEGNACTIDRGVNVTLTAQPNGNFRFVNWTGNGCSGANPVLALSNVQASTQCVANFAARVTVNGAANPAAGGSIAATSASAAAQCSGPSCTVDSGSNVSLDVSTNGGFRFTSWSGGAGCSGSNDPLVLNNVTANTTCTAAFVTRFTVTGATTGAPANTAVTATANTGAPAANCGGNACTVDNGVVVTLTAPNVGGYRFTGWTGSGCTDTGSDGNALTLQLAGANAARTCTAGYVQQFTVTFSSAPAGGTVSSAPTGSCNGVAANNCSLTVDRGTNVDLTATPSGGFRVGPWTCADSNPSTAADLDLDNVTQNMTCNATFVRQFTISVASGGLGSVSVAPTGGNACAGNTCTVDAGSSVTITAAENASVRFNQWTGGTGCAGNAVHSFTLNANTTCTASFYSLWARTHDQPGNDRGAGVLVLGTGETYVTGTATTTDTNAPLAARFDLMEDATGALANDKSDLSFIMNGGLNADNNPNPNVSMIGNDIAGTKDVQAIVGSVQASLARPFIMTRGSQNWAVIFSGLNGNTSFSQVTHVPGVAFGFVGSTGTDGPQRTAAVVYGEGGKAVFTRTVCVPQDCGTTTCGSTLGHAILNNGDNWLLLSSGFATASQRQAMLTQLDGNGLTKSEFTFFDKAAGGTGSVQPAGMIAMKDGGYLIYGARLESNGKTNDGFWLKLGKDLSTIEFQGALGNDNVEEQFRGAAETPDGGVVLAGFFQAATYDSSFVHLDDQGKLLSQTAWSSGRNDIVEDVQAVPTGGYIATGTLTQASGSVIAVFPSISWVLRTDEQGDMPFNAASTFQAVFSANLKEKPTDMQIGTPACSINLSGLRPGSTLPLIQGDADTTETALAP